MAKHLLKPKAEIEEEIRRQAQGAARANGEAITISSPVIAVTAEPTQSGSHWFLAEAGEPGRAYAEAAALRVARLWDADDA